MPQIQFLMRNLICYLSITLMLLTAKVALASSKSTQPLLEVAVGWTKPPYVLAESDSGFELELIRTIFNKIGQKIQFVYIPYGRSYSILKQGKMDAVMSLKPGVDIGKTAVLTDSYISYQNVVISLKNKNIEPRRLSDIGRYSIVGFQNATLHLGPVFAQAAKKSPLYIEKADQRKQVEMLMMKRVDVVVMDINIFQYWLKKQYPDKEISDVNIYPFFDKNNYHLGLKDARFKDAFNQTLRQFKKTESYRQLLEKYQLKQ